MPRANQRCNHTGCDHLRPCPDHPPAAPWSTSTRRTTLPADWPTRRAVVLDRDPACQLAYPGTWDTAAGVTSCTGVSVEVDHIGDPTDHRLTMLRGVCAPCHRRRTQQQSAAARRTR